jgi:hypothetical protein
MALTRTHGLAAGTVAVTGSALALEIIQLLRRDETPMNTAATAVAGYTAAPARETALFNLLVSYLAAGTTARFSTWAIRTRGELGPFRNRRLGKHHIHHFLPGIGLAFLSGGASILSRDEELDKYLAVPFGVGAALTLDEAALLVSLEDVYWSEEGILSVQVTLAAVAGLGVLSLVRPASVQMVSSRPGPTPTRAIGTPMKSETYSR